jgi:hypothetical protein
MLTNTTILYRHWKWSSNGSEKDEKWVLWSLKFVEFVNI